MEGEKIITQFTSDLKPYFKIMEDATSTILDQEVSKYPIFVLTQNEMSIGVPLVNSLKTNPEWKINVSTLEEFAGKQLIQMEKVDAFRSIYKDPLSHFCLFVVDPKGAQFVFIPHSPILDQQK